MKPLKFSENFKNPVLFNKELWHTNILHIQKILVVPLLILQIQAINLLFFQAQHLDVFLRDLFIFYIFL
jgi:hypothetical protein